MVQISEAAGTWDLCRYITKSYTIFQQGVAKACEESASSSERSEEDEPCEGGNGNSDEAALRRPDSPDENVTYAMAEGVQDKVMEFDILEEAVER